MADNSRSAIGERLRTQDNRITADPIFVVQQRERIYGVDDPDGYETHVVDDWESEGECGEDLDMPCSDCAREGHCGMLRVSYRDTWKFVTACLTEVGAQEVINEHGHHMDRPRIYVESGWRNAEWKAVRAHYMEDK